MKRIAFFCIPAHGHTNPMLPVAAALVRRGNVVRFYSFQEFEEKIRATGAEYISCDAFLPPLTEAEEGRLKSVSTTEMTVQDIRITRSMDAFLAEEFERFRPDVVYSDAVCFWGKLNAWKHQVSLVVSTSTFAFNRLSSQYMKSTPAEMAGLIFGLPRVSRELKKLRPYGYRVNGVFSLIQSDNQTDTVVYTSRRFQPYAESFSDHYAFVGPSVSTRAEPIREKARPLVYISMGTVINDRPDFYQRCIEALQDQPLDVVISCGNAVDPATLGPLPDNVRVYPSVDQVDLLSRTDVFLTHCGMNSVSESLYMAVPMVLFPQTNEQKAVAQRVTELGAGQMLTSDSAAEIRSAVLAVLQSKDCREAADACRADFLSCSGAEGAAAFIEGAPHPSNGVDVIAALNRTTKRFQLLYWLIVIAAIILIGFFVGWRYVWIIALAANIISPPLGKWIEKRRYATLLKQNTPD